MKFIKIDSDKLYNADKIKIINMYKALNDSGKIIYKICFDDCCVKAVTDKHNAESYIDALHDFLNANGDDDI